MANDRDADGVQRGDLQSYAEQDQLPLHGGPEEAAVQRQEADHVDQHREGGDDPLSASDGSVHERSRRGGGGRTTSPEEPRDRQKS